MKILMLTPYLPFPLYSGGQIRSYNLIKNLSRKHKITLFSFIRSDAEKVHLQELKKYCHKVMVFKRRQAWDPRNILLAALTPYPFLVSIYLSQTFKQAIAAELSSQKYDLIHAETFYVLPNLPSHISTPTLLVEQTIEYLVYQHFVETTKLFFLKPLLYFDVFKIKLWEKLFWRRASCLAVMSESDKQIMQTEVAGLKDIHVVANGVDVEHFASVARRPQPKNPEVLFVGNFKWLPNKDAAIFLAESIWPLIIQRLPQAKLLIVGRNPTPRILKLNAIAGVKVLADVTDIRQVLSQASVLLAPIRNGRGTKYKVLEAMASGLPVVTTKLGIEGINVTPEAVQVAESAPLLAKKTLAVLTDRGLAQKMAITAQKLVYKRYNWTAISLELDQLYQQLGGA
ncbi:MAG: glycosyltransferase family 4 protein [Patescibacteria group bacterium]